MESDHFLPRVNELPACQDYSLLRRKGVELIERLARAQWTDHNAHDPGITLLELMAYGLTDLGWRASYKVRDLLTETEGGVAVHRGEFHLAHEQLVSAPVTFDDLRKVLLDIPGVRGAWVRRHDLESDWSSASSLRGLFDVYLEYEDIENIDKANVRQIAIQRIHANRGLCQDLLSVAEVTGDDVSICGDIELTADAEVDDVCAEVLFRVQQHVSPSTRFYSMEELCERGRSIERIFEGPRIEHGFIDADEFAQQKQRCELRVSDIIAVILGVPGVVAVKSMKLVFQSTQEHPVHDWVLDLGKNQLGGVTLNPAGSKLLFYKRNVPYFADKETSLRLLKDRRAADLNARLMHHTKVLDPPVGEARQVTDYLPLQNELPNAYCVGRVRVPKSAPPLRHAQSRQLKGYLLLIEQLYADFLAQLGSLRRLFSWSEQQSRTYFTQPIEGVEDLEQLYTNAKDSAAYSTQVAEQLERPDVAPKRRLEFLEHLAARYAEEFDEYHAVTRLLSGKDADEKWVHHLRNFLGDYPATSAARGTGFNWLDPTNKCNVAGYQRRVYRLLGIDDVTRRVLAGHQLTVVSEGNETGQQHYFELRRSGTVLFSSRKCKSKLAAEALLDRALCIGGDERNYKWNDSKRAYSLMPCNDVSDLTDSLGETQGRNTLPKVIKYLSTFGESEGFHLVEHILLRPRTVLDPLLSSQDASLCPIVSDPYSFQASVILPCWPSRFRDAAFRRFVEETLRSEAPAHVQLRICWISHQQMAELERVLLPWQNKLAKHAAMPGSGQEHDTASRVGLAPLPARERLTDKDRGYSRTMAKLTNVLQNLTTVYPLARLHDCQDPGRAAPSPVTLDSTSLGTL